MAATSTDKPAITLHNVEWDEYCKLRDDESRSHMRMNYLDGELTIMSPDPIHEEAADLLSLVVRGTAAGSGLAIKGLRTTTLRRGGTASGKEPDNAFYVGPHVEAMTSFRKRRKLDRGPAPRLDLDVDPPPDLAIKVDHTRDSIASLAIYARLGVREVWRFDVLDDAIRFYQLTADGHVEVPRSTVLPRLTPDLVLQALDLLDEMVTYDEVAYLDRLRDGARALPLPAEGPGLLEENG